MNLIAGFLTSYLTSKNKIKYPVRTYPIKIKLLKSLKIIDTDSIIRNYSSKYLTIIEIFYIKNLYLQNYMKLLSV